jgi:hypothetical protein
MKKKLSKAIVGVMLISSVLIVSLPARQLTSGGIKACGFPPLPFGGVTIFGDVECPAQGLDSHSGGRSLQIG